MNGLSFDPLLPWPVVAAIAVLAGLIAIVRCGGGCRAGSGAGWRGWPRRWRTGGNCGALESGIRDKLSDIVILLDDTPGQSLPGRTAQSDAAIEYLTRQLAALPGTEIRRVSVGDDADGTLIGTALTRALAAEPQARVAGVIAVTDGLALDAAMV